MKQSMHEKKIGIFGGSFDPIHRGHLNIARSAKEEFALDEVWFIPSGHSPHKDDDNMASAESRAEMITRAIAQYPDFSLSRVEMDEPGVSYTYQTLTRLRGQYPNTKFYFIMGADSLDYLDQWRHPEIICEIAIILVAVRGQMDLDKIREKTAYIQSLFSAQIEPIQGGRTKVSSTGIRRQLAEGDRPDMLPDAVWNYIRENGLYGAGQR